MLLSYLEIVRLVEERVIENTDLSKVNGASLDITLGGRLIIEAAGFVAGAARVVDFSKRDALPGVTIPIDTEEGYILKPGEFVLAQSREVFHLPNDIAAEYKLKSSMARIGLNHLNAGWCDPTWHGSVLTLELVNTLRNHAVRIRAGDPIGQVVFFRCAPVPDYASYAKKGRYNKDKQVTGIKL